VLLDVDASAGVVEEVEDGDTDGLLHLLVVRVNDRVQERLYRPALRGRLGAA
jgi:hypothetical protein